MLLRIDYHSGEPIYQQIVEQIKYRTACGQLTDGTLLPSIRTLAQQLKINPRTVVRAYEELQHAGLVVMKQGQGVFITVGREAIPAGARRKQIARLARRMLAEANRLGASPDEAIEILEAVAKEMRQSHVRISSSNRESGA